MKYSFIICGYNEECAIDLCVQSCLSQDYNKNQYEIIYVDNNSSDNSILVANKYPIKVIEEKKQGLSEARNCGIKNSSGEILVFLDVDLKLDKNYLKHHDETFLDSGVGAGGGKVLPIVKTWVSDYLGVSLLEGYPRFIKQSFVNTYPGCNLTIRKSVLNKIGNFKEGLVSAEGVTRFAEDKEICERIRSAGYKILYNPLAIVLHENTHTFSKLFNIWVKGAKGRVNLIQIGKKDIFSLMFKFNLPLLCFAAVLILPFIHLMAALWLIMLFTLSIFLVCLATYYKTRLFFQCFIIKPWMDPLSLMIVNLTIIYKRIFV